MCCSRDVRGSSEGGRVGVRVWVGDGEGRIGMHALVRVGGRRGWRGWERGRHGCLDLGWGGRASGSEGSQGHIFNCA